MGLLNMNTILTYKYRIKDKHKINILSRMSFSVNQVWNFCVATQKKTQLLYKQGSNLSWLSQYDLQKLTKSTSHDLGIHAQSIQNICKQFVQSRNQHNKCPKFRISFGSKKSLGWIPFQEQSRQLQNNYVSYLGNIFKLFGIKRRPIPDKVTGGSFAEDSQGKWYVCLYVDVPNLPTGTGEVGIDLGLNTLATLSTGEKIENPKTYYKYQEKLAVAQRANNKKRVKAIHAKIKNIRKDFLHKAAHKIATENKTIIVGNVNSTQLVKTQLAKAILDTGWYMFRNMLEYKARRHQAYFKIVNESFTTQTCSRCGIIPKESPKGIAGLGIREWVCSNCGILHDRDTNSALNILNLGQGVVPLAEESWVS